MKTTKPKAGVVEEIEPGLRRILADNPSPMTHHGTNTYLVGEKGLAIVDPGPASAAHLARILAVGQNRIETIIVTHAHLDHTAGVAALARETGAEVVAFDPTLAPDPVTARLVAAEGGGGEGVDQGFYPDRILSDGEIVTGSDWSLEVLHTPGHKADHIALAGEFGILSGDHVMDWASTLVSPPDGDLAAFMATCTRLMKRRDRRLHPAHGGSIADGGDRLEWLASHRQERDAAIREALDQTPRPLSDITARVYTDTPSTLLPAAERNVLSHLIEMVKKSEIVASADMTGWMTYRRGP